MVIGFLWGLLHVRLGTRDLWSSVLPIVIGVKFLNHSGCGGSRRYEMRACPIYSSRVAKPAFAAPIGGSPREGFPSQFDLSLLVLLPKDDLHTQAPSPFCPTAFSTLRPRI